MQNIMLLDACILLLLHLLSQRSVTMLNVVTDRVPGRFLLPTTCLTLLLIWKPYMMLRFRALLQPRFRANSWRTHSSDDKKSGWDKQLYEDLIMECS